jgi:hypothetical protein
MNNPASPARLRELSAELAEPKPMRRGSLSERTVKCGKPGYPCGEAPDARHGPYFSLTRAVKGKTHSRFLTSEQAAVVRQQIEAGHQFRAAVDALWEESEAWADSQLDGSSTASAGGAEKKGFRRAFKTRSSKKSKRS